MGALLKWGLVCLSGALLSACGARVTPEECNQLLDHYTEKVIDQARPSTSLSQRMELVQQAREKAAQDPEFASCTARVSRRKWECAMRAPDADEVERCLL